MKIRKSGKNLFAKTTMLVNSLVLHAPLQCNFVKKCSLFLHPLNLALAQFMPKVMGCGRSNVVLVINFHLLSWTPKLSC